MDRVRILGVETLSARYGTLTETTFVLRRRDGRESELTRETYRRGDAAAVLPIDRARDTVLLVRQFRLATRRENHDGMMLEAIAGMLDSGAAAETVVREAEEEAGLRIGTPEFLFEAFMSPGAFAEKLSFFLAAYTEADRTSTGGGLEGEGEDIEVVELAFEDALAAVEGGRIIDAKTIMLLQAATIKRISKARL